MDINSTYQTCNCDPKVGDRVQVLPDARTSELPDNFWFAYIVAVEDDGWLTLARTLAPGASQGRVHVLAVSHDDCPEDAPDCACCGMNFYRTKDGDCTYCAGAIQVCCRN